MTRRDDYSGPAKSVSIIYSVLLREPYKPFLPTANTPMTMIDYECGTAKYRWLHVWFILTYTNHFYMRKRNHNQRRPTTTTGVSPVSGSRISAVLLLNIWRRCCQSCNVLPGGGSGWNPRNKPPKGCKGDELGVKNLGWVNLMMGYLALFSLSGGHFL